MPPSGATAEARSGNRSTVAVASGAFAGPTRTVAVTTATLAFAVWPLGASVMVGWLTVMTTRPLESGLGRSSSVSNSPPYGHRGVGVAHGDRHRARTVGGVGPARHAARKGLQDGLAGDGHPNLSVQECVVADVSNG